MTFIGIDIGTSGVRACAIDASGKTLALHGIDLPAPFMDGDKIEQDAILWWQAVEQVLYALVEDIDAAEVKSIAIDGTSGSVLVTDRQGIPLAPALMYNDSRCRDQAEQISAIAPADSAAHGSSSGLAKLLYLYQHHPRATHALHQADWIAGQLCGRFDTSDSNNALKSGFDVLNMGWPDWLQQLNFDTALLPRVITPGSIIGNITAAHAQQFGFHADTRIVAGTTDSIAAFIATGAAQPGTAVTSLGSTLVVKIISEQPVYSPQHGIYSHRLGDYWLAGGASNSGGAVLKKYFSNAQLRAMTPKLHPQQATGLDYYPLTKAGERFPVNDPQLQPRLQPRPDDDVDFFQGILESIARIEHQAYAKLHELGAPYPVTVLSAGGGSHNPAWTEIRQAMLGVPVKRAEHSDACYGSALLARQGTTKP